MKRFNWVGVFIVLLGLYWLLSAMGIDLHIGRLFWPVMLFCAGLISCISARRPTFWSMVFIIGGAYWALVVMGIVTVIDFSIWIAVLIIILGVSILFPRISGGHRSPVGDSFSSTSVFSGDKRTLVGKTCTGGTVVCLFGGCELDITGYEQFAPVVNIHVTTLFGGGELIVPRNARVERRGFSAIFGGMGIKGAPAPDAGSVIEVSGLSIFGGINFTYR